MPHPLDIATASLAPRPPRSRRGPVPGARHARLGAALLLAATAAGCADGLFGGSAREPVVRAPSGPVGDDPLGGSPGGGGETRVPEPAPPPRTPAGPPPGAPSTPPSSLPARLGLGPVFPPGEAPYAVTTDPGPPADPLIFTWQEPLGAAADDPRFEEFVRRSAANEPEETARSCVRTINRRGLAPGRIAVLLQDFGMGHGDPADNGERFPALFKHWCDGLPHRPLGRGVRDCGVPGVDAVEKWWETPWMSEGIRECRTWMDRFIAEWKRMQAASPDIPDPDRFHFDTEHWLVPWRTGMTEAFDAMTRDPRWASEPVPGHDGRTIAELYRDGGEPSFRPDRRSGHPDNVAWMNWYADVCHRAMEGAMLASAYLPLHEAWPAVETSNYSTSERVDGRGETRWAWRQNSDVVRYREYGMASMQAPVLYWDDPKQYMPDMDAFVAASLEDGRRRLDANILSGGGPDARVIPWIELAGSRRTKGDWWLQVPLDMQRDMFALLRFRGVHEIAGWSGDSTQRTAIWDGIVGALDDAWTFDLARAEVERGAVPAGLSVPGSLRVADGAPLRATSAPSGSGHAVEIVVRFDVRRPAAAGRGLAIDLRASATGTARARLTLGRPGAAPALRPAAWSLPASLSDHRVLVPLDDVAGPALGPIEVRIEITGDRAFTALIDGIHAFVTDAPG